MCRSPGRGKESDTTERLDYGNKQGGGCELNGDRASVWGDEGAARRWPPHSVNTQRP